MPGDAIAFHGSGFSDNDAINVWVTNPDGSTSAVASDLSSTNGELWFDYDVPRDGVGGTYYMAAYDQTSGHLQITSFTVGS